MVHAIKNCKTPRERAQNSASGKMWFPFKAHLQLETHFQLSSNCSKNRFSFGMSLLSSICAPFHMTPLPFLYLGLFKNGQASKVIYRSGRCPHPARGSLAMPNNGSHHMRMVAPTHLPNNWREEKKAYKELFKNVKRRFCPKICPSRLFLSPKEVSDSFWDIVYIYFCKKGEL